MWSEQIGLVGRERTIPLGIEMRALAELISKKSTRDKLTTRIRDHIDQTRRDHHSLARFNALLGWYFEEVYPETIVQGTDGMELKEQSNICRALDKQIKDVQKFLESQNGNNPITSQEFIYLSLKYRNEIDSYAPLLIDRKRSLKTNGSAPDTSL